MLGYYFVPCCFLPLFFVVATYLPACMVGDDLHGGINQAPIYCVFYTTHICFLEKMNSKMPHVLV